jgi:enoyl-CoA hydratase/carnithine racemase
MDFKNLIFEVKGPIAKITVHRPEVLNAVDYPTVLELKEVLSHIEKEP